MHSEFWHKRWETGRIGFHQSQVNALLKRYWVALQSAGEGRVLVPLCGKSLDMIWLREQGHEVTGVELNAQACEAFWQAQSSNDSVPITLYQGAFACREVEGLRTLCGDFFALPVDEFNSIAWVYDRAALIAFPEAMRRRYARKLSKQLPAGVGILLITLEFEGCEGPPFAVSEAEVHELYGERFEIQRCHSVSLERRDAERSEVVYLLRDRMAIA
ncbi:thiopurine S-methyltransferase [Amphritea sp. 1_MG-2023]|uniref:thiopurine S-methyltransferase n=1 Tax=Amphritea sp. 1_MG-2023 TaxID=3062670 RepID=UPI0026E27176|nr:thiopurine S-methyltransferase [Amphritea sp. 1_MG-2023]MDO6563650.1 thiopurine S-methyltransferase [Amphritea sp. 1_MG-2023]